MVGSLISCLQFAKISSIDTFIRENSHRHDGKAPTYKRVIEDPVISDALRYYTAQGDTWAEAGSAVAYCQAVRCTSRGFGVKSWKRTWLWCEGSHKLDFSASSRHNFHWGGLFCAARQVDDALQAEAGRVKGASSDSNKAYLLHQTWQPLRAALIEALLESKVRACMRQAYLCGTTWPYTLSLFGGVWPDNTIYTYLALYFIIFSGLA